MAEPRTLTIPLDRRREAERRKYVKLASASYLDELPDKGNEFGQAFRDREMEARLLKIAHSPRQGAALV